MRFIFFPEAKVFSLSYGSVFAVNMLKVFGTVFHNEIKVLVFEHVKKEPHRFFLKDTVSVLM